MTRPSAALQVHRERILELARAHGARNVRVFGSAARGADREGSDLDLLVDVDDRATLFTLAGLQEELSRLLGLPVDVRTKRLARLAEARAHRRRGHRAPQHGRHRSRDRRRSRGAARRARLGAARPRYQRRSLGPALARRWRSTR